MNNKYQEALNRVIIFVEGEMGCAGIFFENKGKTYEAIDTLKELVDKENCNIEEVGSWGYFGGCRHITDDVKFAYLRGEIELTNEQKFWFLGQLINKSKNKLSTSHNLICNMRGMGGTDKSVLKKLLGVED